MANTMKSIASGVVPALSIAIFAASTPMVVVVSSVRWAYRLSFTPVRSWIHSSDVSMYFRRSLFVTTCEGTYMPIPAIFDLIIASKLKTAGPAGKGR